MKTEPSSPTLSFKPDIATFINLRCKRCRHEWNLTEEQSLLYQLGLLPVQCQCGRLGLCADFPALLAWARGWQQD